MNVPQLAGWIPYSLGWHEGQARVDWCHLDGRRLTAPFFTETLSACMQLPFNLLFRQRTSVDTLLEWHERQPGLQPAGFIFHMSRCGSTLIGQMLAASPRHVVVSEAGPLDAVLHAHFRDARVTDADRCRWLRAMLSALGQRWGGSETHLFVKFDSWHVLHFPLIRQTFPDVPWIFAYRNPSEVLVSQMKQRGAQMVPGMIEPGVVGVDLPVAVHMPPEEYCARLLGRFCQAGLDYHRDGGMLVNYRELPEAASASIARHFGIAPSAADLEQMQAKARLDAKNPYQPFSPDAGDKIRAATDLMREMAEVWVNPIYQRLEADRTAQPKIAS